MTVGELVKKLKTVNRDLPVRIKIHTSNKWVAPIQTGVVFVSVAESGWDRPVTLWISDEVEGDFAL